MIEQVPFNSAAPNFGGDDFATNPEPRCPVVLLLDTSGSMSGQPIAELNDGLRVLQRDLVSDELASRRVEIAIVSFGPVRVVADFHTANAFIPPTLDAEGDTPMGGAVRKALELIAQRKDSYRANGISFYRPWIFLITDGSPTDDWQSAAREAKDGELARKHTFFAVGVDDADLATLAHFTARQPVSLRGLQFRELFQWLSNSMKTVSRSRVDDTVPLTDPTVGPNGWAFV